jgi:putative ABC transport system permease protein
VVEKQVRRAMEARYGAKKFRVDSSQSFLSILGNVTMILQILLGVIGGLSLLVGGIGIMNIMLVSVTERTREIGLRKALGATSGQIGTQFLIEAIMLTVLGGGIGIMLAVGALAGIVSIMNSLKYPFFNTFLLDPLTIIIALGVSVGVGLIFGVWPAQRAANLDPIECLRYE